MVLSHEIAGSNPAGATSTLDFFGSELEGGLQTPLQHEHRSRSLSAQDFLPVDFDLPHQTPQCALDVLYLTRSQHAWKVGHNPPHCLGQHSERDRRLGAFGRRDLLE